MSLCLTFRVYTDVCIKDSCYPLSISRRLCSSKSAINVTSDTGIPRRYNYVTFHPPNPLGAFFPRLMTRTWLRRNAWVASQTFCWNNCSTLHGSETAFPRFYRWNSVTVTWGIFGRTSDTYPVPEQRRLPCARLGVLSFLYFAQNRLQKWFPTCSVSQDGSDNRGS